MYLAAAVAKLGNPQVFVTFLIEILFTRLFQAARFGSVSSSITSQSYRGRIKLQGYQVSCGKHHMHILAILYRRIKDPFHRLGHILK